MNHVSIPIRNRLTSTSTLSQIAQCITNLEHFEVACGELEKSLTSLRSAQRGGTIRLTAGVSFTETVKSANSRISSVIASKLDDFFELADYDWTPKSREDTPSMYLFELAHWLATVVDSLVVQDAYKDEAYKAAVQYIADCLMVLSFSLWMYILLAWSKYQLSNFHLYLGLFNWTQCSST